MDTFSPEDENFSTKKTFEEYEKLWEYFHTSPSDKEWNKYKSFEEYAKLIANENCVLSIFEYTKFRTNLNKEEVQVSIGVMITEYQNAQQYGLDIFCGLVILEKKSILIQKIS